MKYRLKYAFAPRFKGCDHDWSLVGRLGGLNLRITDYGEEFAKKNGNQYSGGLEMHYRQPPDYMGNQAPSHDHCWLLKCPCWHDGTSVYVSTVLIPFWRFGATSHEEMFRRLESEADERFGVLTGAEP